MFKLLYEFWVDSNVGGSGRDETRVTRTRIRRQTAGIDWTTRIRGLSLWVWGSLHFCLQYRRFSGRPDGYGGHKSYKNCSATTTIHTVIYKGIGWGWNSSRYLYVCSAGHGVLMAKESDMTNLTHSNDLQIYCLHLSMDFIYYPWH